MNEVKFRILVLLPFFVMAIGAMYSFWWPNPVVDELYDHLDKVDPQALDFGDSIFLVGAFSVTGLILYVVSVYGLLVFRGWARPLYTASNIILFGTYFMFGVTVSDPVSDALLSVENMLVGAVIAVSYSQPISVLFGQKI